MPSDAASPPAHPHALSPFAADWQAVGGGGSALQYNENSGQARITAIGSQYWLQAQYTRCVTWGEKVLGVPPPRVRVLHRTHIRTAPPDPAASHSNAHSHVAPGMTILSIGGGATDPAAPDVVLAALDATAGRLVVIAINLSANATQTLTVDLSAFTAVAGPVTRWATDTGRGGTDRYTRYADVALAGKAFTVPMKPQAVHTFEVAGVRV